jgi:hypothetical protein
MGRALDTISSMIPITQMNAILPIIRWYFSWTAL